MGIIMMRSFYAECPALKLRNVYVAKTFSS